MTKRKKLLLSTAVVGVMSSFIALGVFGLFSATTQNSGNEISSGTVLLSDNDSGSSLFNVTGAKPGDAWTRCIKVSYNGTLPADVHLYMQNVTGPLAPYVNLTMTQGTQASPTFPGCTGFTPDATGVIFTGPVYSPVQGSWDLGLPVVPAGSTNWQSGTSLVFKFTATLDPTTPDTQQNSSIGTSTIVWEARNAA
ncbi:MAG: hypothetical protein QOD14_357 [Solirubrobacterales bacterium]|jgi:hypothetical protein|nr:hypothetical protein [Solirubrobacterales bacterium]